MVHVFALFRKNREPMDYIDGKPVYPNRKTRKALKEVEEYERGERELETIDLEKVHSRDVKPTYNIVITTGFRKDLKKAEKGGLDLAEVWNVVDVLADGKPLPDRYHDHKLTGVYEGYRECHIRPNWLLIYELLDREMILHLIRTGTHSDLFDE